MTYRSGELCENVLFLKKKITFKESFRKTFWLIFSLSSSNVHLDTEKQRKKIKIAHDVTPVTKAKYLQECLFFFLDFFLSVCLDEHVPMNV